MDFVKHNDIEVVQVLMWESIDVILVLPLNSMSRTILLNYTARKLYCLRDSDAIGAADLRISPCSTTSSAEL